MTQWAPDGSVARGLFMARFHVRDRLFRAEREPGRRDAPSHLEQVARDPLAAELAAEPRRGTSLTQWREREANDFPSGGWSIGEPLSHAQPLLPVAPGQGAGQRRVTPLTQAGETLQDNRRFTPEREARPAMRLNGRPAQIVATALQSKSLGVFRDPTSVIPCIQRKTRKEVMFAKRKAGHGYKRRKRRNWQSDIPC